MGLSFPSFQAAPLGLDRPGNRSNAALLQGGADPSQITSEFCSQPAACVASPGLVTVPALPLPAFVQTPNHNPITDCLEQNLRSLSQVQTAEFGV